MMVLITSSAPRGIGQDHVHHHMYDVMQSYSTAFLHVGEGCFALLMHPEEYPL